MAQRVLTALVGVPLLVGAIWLGTPWLTILVIAAALLGLREFYQMTLGPEARLLLALGTLWTALMIIGGQLSDDWFEYAPHLLVGGGVILAAPWVVATRNADRALTTWSYAVGGPIYIGFLLAHAPMLRDLDGGSDVARDWLLFTLLVTFSTDTGAFLVGRAVGKHLMTPTISPGKTWEGAIGGFLWAVAVAVALDALLQLSAPLWQPALMGVAIAVSAQLGDLSESCLKRAAGVKDAGAILPGHGGILDRLDSIVFTIPLMYYLVALVLDPFG